MQIAQTKKHERRTQAALSIFIVFPFEQTLQPSNPATLSIIFDGNILLLLRMLNAICYYTFCPPSVLIREIQCNSRNQCIGKLVNSECGRMKRGRDALLFMARFAVQNAICMYRDSRVWECGTSHRIRNDMALGKTVCKQPSLNNSIATRK